MKGDACPASSFLVYEASLVHGMDGHMPQVSQIPFTFLPFPEKKKSAFIHLVESSCLL